MAKKLKPNQVIEVVSTPGEKAERAVARFALTPSIHAASIVQDFVKIGEGSLDLNSLVLELRAQSAAGSRGDLGRAEAMLMSQAHALEAIFSNLARRSHINIGQNLDVAERYMRLALKAQSQCRATLETLAAIKNPPVVYARQANIANGPQQVNNAPLNDTRARTREDLTRPTELLEQSHGQWLDTGATSEAIRSDPEVATVGAIDGTTHT